MSRSRTDLKPLTAIGQFGVCRWHNAKGKIRNLKYTWLIVIQSVMYGIMDVVSKQAYQIMSVFYT
jgi:hypothetical protein